jgi:hypothetical protein
VQAQEDIIAHELGHNLGLYHSDLLNCPTGNRDVAVNVPLAARCGIEEYGDIMDVMSWSNRGLNESIVMGSLSSPQAVTVGFNRGLKKAASSGSTQVTLSPVTATSGTRALSVVDPVSKETYWVELRSDSGVDQNLGGLGYQISATQSLPAETDYFSYGVRILKIISGQTAASLKPLNGGTVVVPNTASEDSARATVFSAGQTFTSMSGHVRVAVNAVSSTSASVTVGVTPAAAPPAPQRVSGNDRYATAAAVSKATFSPGVKAAFVAVGTN